MAPAPPVRLAELMASLSMASDLAMGQPVDYALWSCVLALRQSERAVSQDIVEKLARLCEKDSAGLPIGVQIAARPWREREALAAMAVVEKAARRSKDFPARTPL